MRQQAEGRECTSCATEGRRGVNLVEWLEVQLAEDERRAKKMHARRCETPASWTSTDNQGRPFETPCDCDWHVGSVLAECEAKRRIIRAHNKWCDGTCGSPDGPSDAYPFHQAHYWSMQALAVPYADRPGYDETWRP